jgi:toxin ParE1/3/4
MAGYSLSSKAAADLEDIYEYAILNFGLEQARTYLSGLQERFELLARNPKHGRAANELSPGLRRLTYQSHIVFYIPRTKASGSCAFCTKAWTRTGISSVAGE